jgi:NADH-quinone oxidoreductase subunit L
VGAFLTALYVARIVVLVFLGEHRGAGSGVGAGGGGHARAMMAGAGVPEGWPGLRFALPLVVLAVLSLAGGLVETPGYLGGLHLFGAAVAPVLGGGAEPHGDPAGDGAPPASEIVLMLVAVVASLAGIYVAYRWFVVRPRRVTGEEVAGGGRAAEDAAAPPIAAGWQRLWREGWGFDRLYERLCVRPWCALGLTLAGERVDAVIQLVPDTLRRGHRLLGRTQSGMLRLALGTLSAGAAVVLALMVLS